MRTNTLLLAVLLGMITLLIAPELTHAYSHSGFVSCNYCHKRPFKSQRASICLSCHGPGGSSTLRAAAHGDLDCKDCHSSMGGRENWQGSVNIKSLRGDVDKTGQHSDENLDYGYVDSIMIKAPAENYAQVVFTSRGTGAGEPSLHSFADGDQDRNGIYDGICEVCHLEFLYQNEQASGPHHIGETCTSCHLHSNGFR